MSYVLVNVPRVHVSVSVLSSLNHSYAILLKNCFYYSCSQTLIVLKTANAHKPKMNCELRFLCAHEKVFLNRALNSTFWNTYFLNKIKFTTGYSKTAYTFTDSF